MATTSIWNRFGSKRGDIMPFALPTWYSKTTTGNTIVLLACCMSTAAVRNYLCLARICCLSSALLTTPVIGRCRHKAMIWP